MITIESTPQMAAALYAAMDRTLAIVRERLSRPLTLSEKLLLGHLDDPHRQPLDPGASDLALRPDRVVFQDVLAQTAMLQFLQTGLPRIAVPATIHCDHLIQARTGAAPDLLASLDENREVYDFLRSAAARFGAGFWEPGAGIIHQVVLENYAFPGQLIIGADSHTPNAGGLGSCAIGVGGADAVEVIAGLPWELRYPRAIAVYLTGSLAGWTAPKDVILWVASQLGVSGATNSILEYIGPGARTLSATGKATICNMGAELGATTSLFPADDAMARYLSATARAALAHLADLHRDLLVPDAAVEAEPGRYYHRVLTLDLSALEPHVAGPHSPGRSRPLSQFTAEFHQPISAVLIGSCTNSSYQDLDRAASIAAQARARGLSAATPFYITPGSERVRATVERDGQLQSLQSIGGAVLANACGPCIGQCRRPDAADRPNAIVSSYNRNFPGRNDGYTATMNFIVSPELATAFALAGSLSFNPLTGALPCPDGTSLYLQPPAPAPELPPDGFASAAGLYLPPSAARPALQLRAASDRLQPLSRWPAWDGHDFLGLPVLAKARGKTTTDQISPAGPWLRYRGNLEKFSDNFLSGAVNDFTSATGTVRDGRTFAAAARDYRARSLRWVVIGDTNYGEGSSREHAALSPRLLGAAAVIARSFARIHETNLKKQGLLALTFQDPAAYDLIREDDRLSLVNLSLMAPESPVECIVQHSDGKCVTLVLNHSYSLRQLAWFRAGSALNLLAVS